MLFVCAVFLLYLARWIVGRRKDFVYLSGSPDGFLGEGIPSAWRGDPAAYELT